MTGHVQGQAMLERLEQGNLFLVPLDDERHWYRYHHLLADVLRQRLQQRMPDLIQQASTWYEQHGWHAEAVGHALSAADVDRAARLVEQGAAALIWKRGEAATLLGWLDDSCYYSTLALLLSPLPIPGKRLTDLMSYGIVLPTLM